MLGQITGQLWSVVVTATSIVPAESCKTITYASPQVLLHYTTFFLAAVLSIRQSEHKWLMWSNIHSIPSVSLSVCSQYCGKISEWIRMLLGMVSGVRLGISVLDFVGDCRRGRSSL